MTKQLNHKRWHHSGILYRFGKHATQKKEEIEYEKHPPSCSNCYAFQPRFNGGNGQPARPDYCLKHQLLLSVKTGICNTWESSRGETLENT